MEFLREYISSTRMELLILQPTESPIFSMIFILNGSNLNLLSVRQPDIYGLETFRHHSFITPAAKGVIAGFGASGYTLALRALIEMINIQE